MAPESATSSVPTIAAAASRSSATVEMSTKASRLKIDSIRRSGARCGRILRMSRPPANPSAIISPRKSQPIGDWLKAWRLLKMPLRVRNVAKLHSPNVAMTSPAESPFKMPRWRQAMRVWTKAVPVSQGASDPFSTGSQAQ